MNEVHLEEGNWAQLGKEMLKKGYIQRVPTVGPRYVVIIIRCICICISLS